MRAGFFDTNIAFGVHGEPPLSTVDLLTRPMNLVNWRDELIRAEK